MYDDHWSPPSNVSSFIVGFAWQRSRVKRERKYAVSKKEYSANYYPDFCSGAGYAMTPDALVALLGVTSQVSYLKRDDPYFTGVLASQAGISRFNFQRNSYVLSSDDFSKKMIWHDTMLVDGANQSSVECLPQPISLYE